MGVIDTGQMQLLSRVLDTTAARHKLIASNLANVDTPNYKTRDLNFSTEMKRAEGIVQWAEHSPVATPVPGLMERPDGNNVSLERETLLMAQNQLQFRTAAELLRSEFHRLSLAIHEGK